MPSGVVHALDACRILPEELRKSDAVLETFRNVNTLSAQLAMGPEALYQEKHPGI